MTPHHPVPPDAAPGRESFRATLTARSPDGGRHTVIVLRRDSRVWLCLNGAWKYSAVLTNAETSELIDVLTRARTPARCEPES